MRVDPSTFYKFLTVLVAAIFLAVPGLAQGTFELSWTHGQVVLASGDTITGAITVRNPDDIVIVSQADGAISTFSAVGVQSFRVRDEKPNDLFRRASSPLDFSRHYQTYQWNRDRDYSNFKAPAFFIVLRPGKNTLLMREVKVRQYSNAGYGDYQGARIMQERIEDKFYLLGPDQEIKALRNPKKDLPAIFPQHAREIRAFAKENHLNFNNPFELSQIVHYLNSL